VLSYYVAVEIEVTVIGTGCMNLFRCNVKVLFNSVWL